VRQTKSDILLLNSKSATHFQFPAGDLVSKHIHVYSLFTYSVTELYLDPIHNQYTSRDRNINRLFPSLTHCG